MSFGGTSFPQIDDPQVRETYGLALGLWGGSINFPNGTEVPVTALSSMEEDA